MTNSLADLMRGKWQEPPEIKTVKDFVKSRYQVDVKVSLAKDQIRIHTPSSALAATLRMDLETLKNVLKTDKKLVIKIG